MELAMIGLGRMGGGMARRLLAAGHSVVAYSRSGAAARVLADEAGAVAASSVSDAVEKLAAPRVVWLMLPQGDATAEVIEALAEMLAPGDLVVDGGNSHYRETMARAEALAERHVALVDVGTSGGIRGEQEGYCLMVGGTEDDAARIASALDSLAQPHGWSRVGPTGSGHFVKMVHNGIEYGLMEAYAEGFAILRAKSDFDLDPVAIAQMWQHGSVVRSWLLELAAQAMERDPDLRFASGAVADSGEGRWTVQEAVDLGVATPVIADALLERFASREDGSESRYTGRFLSALRHEFGGHDLGGHDLGKV